MYLDTSRSRFDPARHYSAVLLQQGRVVLDSDTAEQDAITSYYLRAAIADIIGPAGCPAGNAGFGITAQGQTDLVIGPGRIYVDGILAEAVRPVIGGKAQQITYLTQLDGYLQPSGDPKNPDNLPSNASYVVYLRVWERCVTALQDPDIREVALGIHGPDTCGRAQVVWQVAYWTTPTPDEKSSLQAYDAWTDWVRNLNQPTGTLQARARQPDDAETDICGISPQAQFRGRENQHYRVEIFSGGTAGQPAPAAGGQSQAGVARYVWSRDNGSAVFAIESLAGAEVTVGSLGRDLRSGLEIGDYVEITDDALASRVADDPPAASRRALFKVTAIDAVNRVVTLDSDPAATIDATGTNPALHPLLRRWDCAGSAVVTEAGWLELEDGVQVKFPGAPPAVGKGPQRVAQYRTGDYWLVPARTAIADVIWPQDESGPVARPPAGVAYHYAPLAFVPLGGDPVELRSLFDPGAKPPQLT